MIADGVKIDTFSLLKVKSHLLELLGFADVVSIPASTGHAFHVGFGDLDTVPWFSLPCVHQLPAVLDSSHAFGLSPSSMGGPFVEDDQPASVLVGSIFVDVSLAVMAYARELLTLPILTIKSLLESVGVFNLSPIYVADWKFSDDHYHL